MPVFAVPVVLYVDADCFDDAQKVVNDWVEDTQGDLPDGVDGVESQLTIDFSEDGERIAYLPADDSSLSEEDDDDDSDDDDLSIDEGDEESDSDE